jgi:hypothetical protein
MVKIRINGSPDRKREIQNPGRGLQSSVKRKLLPVSDNAEKKQGELACIRETHAELVKESGWVRKFSLARLQFRIGIHQESAAIRRAAG